MSQLALAFDAPEEMILDVRQEHIDAADADPSSSPVRRATGALGMHDWQIGETYWCLPESEWRKGMRFLRAWAKDKPVKPIRLRCIRDEVREQEEAKRRQLWKEIAERWKAEDAEREAALQADLARIAAQPARPLPPVTALDPWQVRYGARRNQYLAELATIERLP